MIVYNMLHMYAWQCCCVNCLSTRMMAVPCSQGSGANRHTWPSRAKAGMDSPQRGKHGGARMAIRTGLALEKSPGARLPPSPGGYSLDLHPGMRCIKKPRHSLLLLRRHEVRVSPSSIRWRRNVT